jgi:hypothetical protein
MLTKDRTCGIIEGTLQDALDSLERTKECMVGWDWSYISPEEVDEVINMLKAIIKKAGEETA